MTILKPEDQNNRLTFSELSNDSSMFLFRKVYFLGRKKKKKVTAADQYIASLHLYAYDMNQNSNNISDDPSFHYAGSYSCGVL